jgi:hypothetical protein
MIESAQAIAAQESPRTTKLYDRTGDAITLDEVERMAIRKAGERMSHTWENAFRSSVNMVQARLLQSHEGPSLERPLELVKGALWLRDAVEAFEDGNEFSQLVEATPASFQRPERTTYIDSWKGVIKSFFRRSGYYLSEGSPCFPRIK